LSYVDVEDTIMGSRQPAPKQPMKREACAGGVVSGGSGGGFAKMLSCGLAHWGQPLWNERQAKVAEAPCEATAAT
jgi:hypothetical protein